MKAYILFDRLDLSILRSMLYGLIVFVASGPGLAMACSCAVPSLESRYDSNENVFTAIVTGGDVTRERVLGSPRLKTFFEVTETFKGSIPFEYFSSHADGNSCGISLQVGVEYLVFAPDTGKIGLCSGLYVVAGDSGQASALGARYVDALRAFKTGANDTLAEPWMFREHQGICSLTGAFPYGDMRIPATINVAYWARMPDHMRPNPNKPDLKAGFTRMTIWVPARDDLSDFPLVLKIADRTYDAYWQEVEHQVARYFVESDLVADFIANLVDATDIEIQSSHPRFGNVDTRADLTNVGESVSQMHQCMSGQLVRMGQ